MRYALVALLFVGCCPLNDTFVKSVDSAWDAIGPEYVQYVEADATLDDNTKTLRKRTAQMLTEVIDEAKNAGS
jgi:hypothetical protein